jgi:drug/metabolite transporter (DMT)-like permease
MHDLLVEDPPLDSKQGRTPRKGWFFSPYVQILLSIVLSAAAQLFLKKGADTSISAMWLGFQGLSSGWVWLGIICMVTSLFSWLYSLRFVPLIIAYNLTGLIHVMVPLCSWYFLGEKIGPLRAFGILLVLFGVFVVARPLISAQEKL